MISLDKVFFPFSHRHPSGPHPRISDVSFDESTNPETLGQHLGRGNLCA